MEKSQESLFLAWRNDIVLTAVSQLILIGPIGHVSYSDVMGSDAAARGPISAGAKHLFSVCAG